MEKKKKGKVGRPKGYKMSESAKEKLRIARALQPDMNSPEVVERLIERNVAHKYAKKLTTDELKKEAYDSFCDHLSKGNPKTSWCFVKGDLTLTCETMETYIKNFPEEFPISKRRAAESLGLSTWIESGREMMTTQKKCQPAIFQIMMRNIFGWDKESKEDREERLKSEGEHLKVVWDALDEKYKKKPE